VESRTTAAVRVYNLDKLLIACEHCIIWRSSPFEKQWTVRPEKLMLQCSKAKQKNKIYMTANVPYKPRI